MVTLGYGDVTARADSEKIVAIFAEIFSVMVFGYVLGSIESILKHGQINELEFK